MSLFRNREEAPAPAEAPSPSGAYSGRLAFDPDREVHTDANGAAVVTEDGGRSWRYADADDVGHNERYGGDVLPFTGTTDEGFASGDPAHAHHNDEVSGPLVEHSRKRGPKVTSHTDAWKEAK